MRLFLTFLCSLIFSFHNGYDIDFAAKAKEDTSSGQICVVADQDREESNGFAKHSGRTIPETRPSTF